MRHAPIAHSQKQNNLTRTSLYRHPLVARIARQQRLLQLLMPTSEETIQIPLWGQPLFRPPLIEQAPVTYLQPESLLVWSDPDPSLPTQQTAAIQSDQQYVYKKNQHVQLYLPNTSVALSSQPIEASYSHLAPDADQQALRSGPPTPSMPDQPVQAEQHIQQTAQPFPIDNTVHQSEIAMPIEYPVPPVVPPTIHPETAQATVPASFEQEVPAFAVEGTPEQIQTVQQADHARSTERSDSRRPRSRTRIEEQPTRSIQPAVPPTTTVVSRVQPHLVPEVRTPLETAMHEQQDSAELLFLPQDTDRSIQTWLARLAGPTSRNSQQPSPTEERGEDRLIPPQNTDRSIKENEYEIAQAESAAQASVTATDAEPPSSMQRTINILHNEARSQATSSAVEQAAASSVQAQGQHQRKEILNPTTRPVPAPLSQNTRNFLRPLIGIDPASVSVYRDAQAEQLTSTYQADAVTRDHEIALAAGHPDDTPETLGLLAHELTHIARLQQPRFIPPIIQNTPAGATFITQLQNVDEETLALNVERRVLQAARQSQQQHKEAVPTQGEQPSRLIGAQPTQPSNTPWNGLPAPWEPLPDWLVSAPLQSENPVSRRNAQSSASIIQSIGTNSPDTLVPGNSNMWLSSLTETAGAVQRAGSERSQSEEITIQQQSPDPERVSTPEADLDALARQVYSRIKRRLGVESRRER